MRATTKEFIYVITLVGVCLLLGKVVWVLPLILLLPTILAYTVDRPVSYLVILAIYSELFSVADPGIATLVIGLPYLIKKAWRGGQVDVSLVFIGVILLTTVGQICVLFLPDLLRAQELSVLPWMRLVPTLLLTVITSFLTIVGVYYNRTW